MGSSKGIIVLDVWNCPPNRSVTSEPIVFILRTCNGLRALRRRKDMAIINYEGLQERGIRYSRAHLWRLCSARKFPKPIKLCPGRSAWLESDIDAWIQNRIAERDCASCLKKMPDR